MKETRQRDAKTESLKAQAARDRDEAAAISEAHHTRQAAEIMAKEAAENLRNVRQQFGKRS